MVKYIMVPQTISPYNLKRISPAYFNKPDSQTEDDFVAGVIRRNQEVGQMPFETDETRNAYIATLDARDALLVEAEKPVRERPEFPVAGPHYIVEESALPGGSISEDNDYFFSCWEWDDGVVVNLTKARVFHMDMIRRVRDVELAKLDVPWMKAVEAGNTSAQTTIAAEKQALRDLPTTFDLTTGVDTAEKLFAKWPAELPAR